MSWSNLQIFDRVFDRGRRGRSRWHRSQWCKAKVGVVVVGKMGPMGPHWRRWADSLECVRQVGRLRNKLGRVWIVRSRVQK